MTVGRHAPVNSLETLSGDNSATDAKMPTFVYI